MRSGRYITQPNQYKAFIPTNLPPMPPIQIEGEMQCLLTEANIAIGKLDTMGYLAPNLNHIIAMYVRKEALLSSQIEGTQASFEDIFEYENQIPVKNANDVEEVVNYIKALNHGMQRLNNFPMSLRLIKEIHTLLLEGVRGTDKTPGEFKKSQNWIGPAGSTPSTASFIPPPPKEAIAAMGELELFLHKNSDIPLLISCALIHYQFETIHPFLDGNGRLGRLLITFYLYWKKALQYPTLYLSYYFKIHRQEYYDRLNLVRTKGDYEQWISFFLKGIIWTCDSALQTIKTVLQLQETHKKRLITAKLSTSYAIALLDYLFEKPHLSIKDTAIQFKISYQSAKSLMHQFVSLNILKEITGKRRDKRYSYWEYLDLLSEGT
ncbi:MAG: cell filamentation protein Fic [Chlamydiae bacterium GWC2_50_10]|nr:MAG: cell filamentation protein Fic [Chlamydiae bacterium GWA2_50_15]OGN54088.1 MAG: cell filamentation protein Fic [Chlamydiae bacterium GWF2_49_8]OGN54486.1 MAG: cell filamentation protein Fic [Chlamydiae bacterium GWC2_50_10]OGN57920.1 MAG: cell filamentation protein Fic [Chlamydiae bacterium RIFCSPHIGHO2_02_FULL_49_29]OGN63543.1 MAG: cell filamentation protein Fic [Chlamydiae bacterium RIFCSPHIGHO2_12_FULL_49_32]OGN68350.1 MAG: cell filamentation protein Fic [Chlamydiae bacterium RIFCSP